MLSAITIVLGFVILIIGNQLPWLFVACVGFISGYYLGQHPLLGISGIQLMMFSVGFAIVGGLLVLYIQRIMLILAGFLCGVYICQFLPASLGWNIDWISWWVLLLAGIACAVTIAIWQSPALILVSSLAGASLIVQYFTFVQISPIILFMLLVLFGITAQWILMQYGRQESE